MSKIKIQGSATGTGILTIQAPTTSTDRTMTIPDSDGTLLTTTGDGSSLTGIDALPTQTSNSGKVLMSDGTDASWVSAGRKNLIINGGFDVWQRGTSFSIGNNSVTYTADRWAVYSNGSSARTATKQEAIINDNVSNALKFAITSPNNTDREFRHKIEDLKRFSSQTLTLSYYAKASTSTSYKIETRRNYGSGGTTLVDTEHTTHTFTTSWQKFTTTFTIPDITGDTFGTGSSLDIMFKLDTIQTHDVYLTNVQLELGSVATDFEHRSYGEELALCQRYYQRWNGISGDESPIAVICCKTGGSNSTGPLLFKGTMRGTPTMSYSQASDFQVLLGSGTLYTNLTSIGFADKGTDSCLIMPYIPSTSNNIPGTLRTGSSSAFIAADAEL